MQSTRIRTGNCPSSKSTFLQTKEKTKSLFFQPKLIVGPTDDVYEREADTIADKVVSMNDGEHIQTKISRVVIQRKCAVCEEEDHLQRKDDGTKGEKLVAPSIVSDALGSGGNPLDNSSRSFMENRFGYDFSNVEIHTDSVAAKSAQSINALAYTAGNSIVFGDGQYSPNSDSGKRLLAHELTHVVQQNNSARRLIQKNNLAAAPVYGELCSGGASDPCQFSRCDGLHKSTASVIQRQDIGDDKPPLPVVVPILTSREIALPCPDSVNSIVPEFIREAQERSVIRWNSEQVMSPTRAQVAKKAFQYLGEWRQRFPAEDPRNPTDSELAIASAEHYCFARDMVASGEYSAGVANAMIEGYTFIKDQLSHANIEWVLALPTNGVTPTKATRCQNDWARKGVNDGLRDWAADHP